MYRSLLLLVLIPFAASGQDPEYSNPPGFLPGARYVGGVIGTGSLDRADVAFGVKVEAAVKAIRQGIIGVDLSVEHWGFNAPHGSFDFDYRFTSVGLTGSGHFGVRGARLDPSIGLGIGYLFANSAHTDTYGLDRGTGIFLIGRVGIRYFLHPMIAVNVDAGFGASNFRFGLTLRPSYSTSHVGAGGQSTRPPNSR